MDGLRMIRRHLSKSLGEVHSDLRSWVGRCPNWLQPPLFGVVFVYAWVLSRGGLIFVPIGIIAFLFGSPSTRAYLGPLLAAVLFYAPLAGFLGGWMYALVRPVLQRLGSFGRYLEFILGAWVYAVVLVFVIMPIIKPADKLSLTEPEGWVISGIIGILFGLALATGGNDTKQKASDGPKVQADPPPSDGAA